MPDAVTVAERRNAVTALDWLAALRQPEVALAWSLPRWEHVVRVARAQRLLARLASALHAHRMLDQVPPQPREHLLSALRLSQYRSALLQRVVEQVSDALDGADYPKVLLKGAAYQAQQLPIAGGRLPSDLDILVPKASLADAQRRLADAGWQETALDAHDQRYYREWAHELPPLLHPRLGLELDVHHTILPPVARVTVDAQRLIDHLQPSRLSGWQVLQPLDLVLHSASHLFFDSEGRGRLRDLVDLDGLLRHFAATDPAWWQRLPQRAQELGLGEPLALALHFTRAWLHTPVPPQVLHDLVASGALAWQRPWLLPLWRRVLHPADPDARGDAVRSTAALLLLARHHWRRMPLRLLLPHLWHKWRVATQPAPIDAPGGDPATR